MEIKYTYCDKVWNASIHTDLKDYECPQCYSKRKKDQRIRKIRKSIEKYITN